MRRALLVFLAVAAMSIPAPSVLADTCAPGDFECSGTNPPPTTTPDDDADAVITSGVQFPGVDADSALGKATAAHAGCNGCEWIISPACIANGAEDSSAGMG